jgi:hypothetical protein
MRQLRLAKKEVPHGRAMHFSGSVSLACRLWDLIPTRFAGKPHYYVVHPWGMDFIEMVEQLLSNLAPGEGPPASSQAGEDREDERKDKGPSYNRDADTIYVWLDLLAFSQHPQLNAQVSKDFMHA